MKALSRAVCCLVVIIVAGCASSKVTEYQPYQGAIDRPDRIIVYDFATTPSDLPRGVAIVGQDLASQPQTPEQLALGRRLGTEIAEDLVAELRGIGLPAVRAVGQPGPKVGTLSWSATSCRWIRGVPRSGWRSVSVLAAPN